MLSRVCLFFCFRFFSWLKRIKTFKCYLDLHFRALMIGFFRSAYVQFRIEEKIQNPARCLGLTMFWLMVSYKFCYQKTFCVFLYGEKDCKLSYTDVIHANIFSPFMIWEFIYRFFVLQNSFLTINRTWTLRESENLRRFKESRW